MSKFSKIFTLFIVILLILFINDKSGNKIGDFISSLTGGSAFEFLKNKHNSNEFNVELIYPPSEIPVRPASELALPGDKTDAEKVSVYFLSLDKNDNSVYKRVEKSVPQGEDKFEYAITTLLKGPDIIEKTTGAYSEIPQNSKLLSVKTSGNNLIIDLSSDFQYGGGTDSIYSRMMQLIKTADANSDGKKVYLYFDGKQANMIGGEGIMISQPLTESSLEI